MKERVAIYAPLGYDQILPPSWLGALHRIFAQIDEREAARFMESFVSGANLELGSPILMVREWITRYRKKNRKTPNTLYTSGNAVLDAWIAWRAGKEMLTYRPRPGKKVLM